MKKFLILFTCSLMGLVLTGCSKKSSSSSGEKTRYKVAIVKQLDHDSLDEIATSICKELDQISEQEGIEITYGQVYSGQNDESILEQIASQVISSDVDVIIPIASLSSQIMTVASDGKIPVVYAAVSDPESALLTDLDYVTGTSDALNTKQIIDMILKVKPNIEKVGLLYSLSETSSEKSIQEAKKYLEDKKIEYIEATGNTNDEIRQATSMLLASGVEAVFTPTDNVVMAAELSIYEELMDAHIPHFTGADSFVRNGAFATCGVNYSDLGKETARLAYRVMKEGIKETGLQGKYEVIDGGIITVNKEVSEKLGISTSLFSEFGKVVEVEMREE